MLNSKQLQQASEDAARFVAMFTGLSELGKAAATASSIARSAEEAQARLEKIKYDIDKKTSDLTNVTALIESTMADETARVTEVNTSALGRAARIVDDAEAQAHATMSDANEKAGHIFDKIRSDEKALKRLTDKVQEAEYRLAEIAKLADAEQARLSKAKAALKTMMEG